MLVVVVLLALAACMMLAGHYTARIEALESNPVMKVRVVPRTQYEDQMGIAWSSEAAAS